MRPCTNRDTSEAYPYLGDGGLWLLACAQQ